MSTEFAHFCHFYQVPVVRYRPLELKMVLNITSHYEYQLISLQLYSFRNIVHIHYFILYQILTWDDNFLLVL